MLARNDNSIRLQFQGQAHIGAGAILKPGSSREKPLVIGANLVVGMGAIVTKDVPQAALWQETMRAFLKRFNRIKAAE